MFFSISLFFSLSLSLSPPGSSTCLDNDDDDDSGLQLVLSDVRSDLCFQFFLHFTI